MERKQKIRKIATRKVAMNYTLSGTPISSGINIMGAVKMCSCGIELFPYQTVCPSCQTPA